MKLSNATLDVLKNFSKINQSIVIPDGNVIKTKNKSNSIFAEFKSQEVFPVTFGIYDLSIFLNVLSILKDFDLEFDSEFVSIKSNLGVTKYTYFSSNLYKKLCDDVHKISLDQFSNRNVSFKITKEIYETLIKMSSLLFIPDLNIISDNNKIKLVLLDNKKSTHSFEISILEQDGLPKFNIILNFEQLNLLLKTEYTIDIHLKERTVKFISDNELTYYLSANKGSVFN